MTDPKHDVAPGGMASAFGRGLSDSGRSSGSSVESVGASEHRAFIRGQLVFAPNQVRRPRAPDLAPGG